MKLGVTILLFLFIVGCSKTSDELKQSGEEYITQGQYDLALQEFQKLIESYPEDTLVPVVNYQIARIYLDNKDNYGEGYQILQSIAAKYPGTSTAQLAGEDIEGFPDWLFNKAESSRGAKNITRSLDALNYLVSNFPSSEIAPKAQYLIGDIYMNDLRDFQKAIAAYRKVTKEFKGSQQDAHAQFMIGYIYANILNDLESARQEYVAFMENYPKHELTPSVKFELDFLGKDINDIPVLKHITGDSPAGSTSPQ